jgi:hypothetical protein
VSALASFPHGHALLDGEGQAVDALGDFFSADDLGAMMRWDSFSTTSLIFMGWRLEIVSSGFAVNCSVTTSMPLRCAADSVKRCCPLQFRRVG